jgi:hypothetical protein
MTACPSCHAEVDAEADLCLECGEPLGDSPAAKAARAEAAANPAPASSEPQRVRAPAPPMRPTIPATGRAKRAREAEPETIRCPGCGVPSRAARCPGCGVVLRHEE